MGQVTITGPYNNTVADADALRAILNAIAAAVNTVDSTQLAVGSVSEAVLQDESVSLAKLKGGQYGHYSKFLDANGVAPIPATEDLIFDGGTPGPLRGPKFTHNVWQAVRTGTYQFRALDGSTFAITPPQDCWAIFFGAMRVLYYQPSAEPLFQAYLAVWDEALGVVTNVVNHIVEAQTDEMSEVETKQKFTLLGMIPATGGVTIRPQPAMKVLTTNSNPNATVTINGRIFVDPKNTWLGCILLPR